VKLAPGKILIPGVMSHATNIVEHPVLVAERIVRLGKVVGRENVMGGRLWLCPEPIRPSRASDQMWAKLKSLEKPVQVKTSAIGGAGALTGSSAAHAGSTAAPAT